MRGFLLFCVLAFFLFMFFNGLTEQVKKVESKRTPTEKSYYKLECNHTYPEDAKEKIDICIKLLTKIRDGQ